MEEIHRKHGQVESRKQETCRKKATECWKWRKRTGNRLGNRHGHKKENKLK